MMMDDQPSWIRTKHGSFAPTAHRHLVIFLLAAVGYAYCPRRVLRVGLRLDGLGMLPAAARIDVVEKQETGLREEVRAMPEQSDSSGCPTTTDAQARRDLAGLLTRIEEQLKRRSR
jgi:hypothetical protein